MVLIVLTLFLVGVQSASAYALPVVTTVGKWLLGQIAGYGLGKGIDRVLGLDYQSQLAKVEADLKAELRRGAGNPAKLQVELEAVKSQLAILRSLLNSRPTQEQLEQFRRQLQKDLDEVKRVQKEHDDRISALERKVQEQEFRIIGLEEREKMRDAMDSERQQMSDARAYEERRMRDARAYEERRMRDARAYEERRMRDATASEDGRKRGSVRFGRRTKTSRNQGSSNSSPQPSDTRHQGRHYGVTLQLRVTGQANTIDIRSTEAFDAADAGNFEIARQHGRYDFRLMADTSCVVDIQGSHNSIYIASDLCGKVRVIQKGTNNRVYGCESGVSRRR
jgi:hypothetical protein